MSNPKGKALAVQRTARQVELAAKREAAAALEAEKAALTAKQLATAQRLAQIVNLTIAGFSLETIAAQTGSTVDEIEAMLTNDTARFVRTQPALRVWVRNWISGKYTAMIEADWTMASDPMHKDKLENQDRVMRMLDRMSKLHGADAPTQSEIKVDAAPEAVTAMVEALAKQAGAGYDASIFDIVDAEIVHEANEESDEAERRSAQAVGESQEGEGAL